MFQNFSDYLLGLMQKDELEQAYHNNLRSLAITSKPPKDTPIPEQKPDAQHNFCQVCQLDDVPDYFTHVTSLSHKA